MPLLLTSSAFTHEGMIPSLYTCEGKDLSPEISWANPPKGTKSFVLIVDDPDAPDPDAPKMTWVHWIVYDIPPTVSSFPKAQGNENNPALPNGAKQGITDFRRLGYGGPCPPIGTHRYFFKLYALDATLGLPPGQTKADVEKAMQGHVLEQATLMGKYKKQ